MLFSSKVPFIFIPFILFRASSRQKLAARGPDPFLPSSCKSILGQGVCCDEGWSQWIREGLGFEWVLRLFRGLVAMTGQRAMHVLLLRDAEHSAARHLLNPATFWRPAAAACLRVERRADHTDRAATALRHTRPSTTLTHRVNRCAA